jgi:serum/glucocorticoid-regulated kinase 2
MDFLNGGELFYHLRREQRFSEERTRFYAAEIILALETLHENGIIYRDLKPENVLLDCEGHIKLTDFGLSKIKKTENEVSHTFCGTPEYLAPEIIRGQGYDIEIDFWALVSFIHLILFLFRV